MARKLVIFGVGQIGELAEFYFRHDTDREVAAFLVDGEYLKETSFHDRPVVAMEEAAKAFPPSEYDGFVAISYSKLNALRTDKVAAMREAGYKLTSYISSKASVFPGLKHGDNCFILEDNTIQPYAKLGENVTLWSGNHIGHHSTIGNNVFIASHIVISGNVTVGDRTFIGVNATVRDGISIGERCIIGMGASILEDCADDGVYPAPKTDRLPIPSSKIKSI